jgi:sec-independent protein translocase protein TatA
MHFALIPGIPTLGPMELIIALVVILLLFGAKRIPELARGLGSGVREFKAGTKEGQLEDKKDKQKKDEEGVTSETKTDDEAKLEEDATVEAEKAEQKRS